MIKKKSRNILFLTPNCGIVFSLILLLLSIVFSLCLGQKEYDIAETGFAITYFLPGVFALLALMDASIEYIDSNRGSIWNLIASLSISAIQAAFGLYAGVAYFTKYQQNPYGNAYKFIAFAFLIILLLLNVFARNLKFFKVLEKKVKLIPLMISSFLMFGLIVSSMAMSVYEIYDITYSGIDKLFTMLSLFLCAASVIASLVLSFIDVPDKTRDYSLAALTFIVFVIGCVAIISRVNISTFEKATFYLDYWQLMTMGSSSISLAFPIGYLGYLISKKKEA